MKIKPLFTTLLIISIILTSCKKEDQKPLDKKTDVVYSETTIDTSSEVEGDTLQNTQLAVSALKTLKQKTLSDLNQATKEDGNGIYKAYRKAADVQVGRLNELNIKLLDEYYNYYNQEKERFIFPAPIAKQREVVKSADLEYWEVGEGMAEIRFKANHYYNLFKGKITDDYEYFLKTEAKDESVLAFADAGVVITFKEVGDRVLSWEKFMVTYPKSELMPIATEKYQQYGQIYLFGLDNTPTFENETIYEENRAEFNRFIAKNPNSHFAQIVKTFVEKFDKKSSPTELLNLIRDELHIVVEERGAN